MITICMQTKHKTHAENAIGGWRCRRVGCDDHSTYDQIGDMMEHQDGGGCEGTSRKMETTTTT